MAALTQDRDTKFRAVTHREPPVEAATIIYAGAMVAINAAGHAVPASSNPALIVIGRADQRFDNSLGVAGAINARIRVGTFRYNNSSGADLIAITNIHATCYAVDDNTVALTSAANARPVAGVICDVDAQGVWVTFS